MLLKNIQENFPFLSVVQYGGNEYVGIIINQDQWVTSMYVYTDIKDEHQEQEFLQLGETWWWESNRMIPINIFLKKDLEKFTNIILTEIKRALKRGDRVELRGFGVFSTNIQKARISRNPKTGEKVNTPEKKTIHFKMSKDLFKKLNDET